MKGPIVSIDVSKGKSDYQAFKEMNVKYTGSQALRASSPRGGAIGKLPKHKKLQGKAACSAFRSDL